MKYHLLLVGCLILVLFTGWQALRSIRSHAVAPALSSPEGGR